ncbi:MAG: 1-acyl-sn-glycerol-3-phosphate acyltransferase [Parvibaculales bacterium]
MKMPKLTYYKVPLLMPVLGFVAQSIAFLLGWKLIGDMKRYQKCVLIGAPHTSNWDYMIFLWGILGLRLRVNVLAKDSLFFWPVGYFFRFFGGVPVDRTKRTSAVEQGIEFLKQADRTVLLIAPEGTRSYNENWKSGFYHMAHGAGVPLVLAKLDCVNKRIYIGDEFEMSGDYEADIIRLKDYFKGATGFNPDNQDV